MVVSSLFLLRHSEVSSCIPKSLRAKLSCVSGSLCSESEVEDITITGGLAETSPSIDAIVSSLQFSDAHSSFVRSPQSSPQSRFCTDPVGPAHTVGHVEMAWKIKAL